jgi:hypothetical protein
MLKELLHRLRRDGKAGPPPEPPELQPSPVPWISDEIWSSWVAQGSDEEEHPALRDPRLYVVTRDDLRRAPSATIDEGAKVPRWATYRANLEELRHLRVRSGGVLDPSWPMCCGRLATLVNQEGEGRSLPGIEAEAGPLDLAFMEIEVWHDWAPQDQETVDSAFRTGYRDLFNHLGKDGPLEGLLLFQCRACGRIYIGSCTP